MRNSILNNIIVCGAMLLSFGTSFATDLKIVLQVIPGDDAGEGTTTEYFSGMRSRTELKWGNKLWKPALRNGMGIEGRGPERNGISQCDRHRILELDPEAHEFKVFETDERGIPSGFPLPTFERHPSGKTLTITTETVDTGERNPMFGRRARHLITTEKHVAEPGACSPSSVRVSDNWFIDFEMPDSCPKNRPRHGSVEGGTLYVGGGCQDKIVYHHSGAALGGFAVETKITTQSGFGRQRTSQSFLWEAWEWFKQSLPLFSAGVTKQNSTYVSRVTELSEAPLDPKLFEVPANYKRVSRLKTDGPLTPTSTLN